jgi:uncharacterized membrane protein
VDLAEPLQVFLLWAHALAAAAWLGGSLFYAVALYPALEEVGSTPDRWSLIAVSTREFREIVRLAILVFVVTGAVLAFSRLSLPRISTSYVAVLGVKVALSLWMFWLAGRLGLPRGSGAARPRWLVAWWLRPQYLILELGTIVYLLSVVLRVLYEQVLGASP